MPTSGQRPVLLARQRPCIAGFGLPPRTHAPAPRAGIQFADVALPTRFNLAPLRGTAAGVGNHGAVPSSPSHHNNPQHQRPAAPDGSGMAKQQHHHQHRTSPLDARQHHQQPQQPSRQDMASTEEEHGTFQITLFVLLSIMLLCLPWTIAHPVTMLFPLALLVMPGTGQAFQPLVGEAWCMMLGAARWFLQNREAPSSQQQQQHGHGHQHDKQQHAHAATSHAQKRPATGAQPQQPHKAAPKAATGWVPPSTPQQQQKRYEHQLPSQPMPPQPRPDFEHHGTYQPPHQLPLVTPAMAQQQQQQRGPPNGVARVAQPPSQQQQQQPLAPLSAMGLPKAPGDHSRVPDLDFEHSQGQGHVVQGQPRSAAPAGPAPPVGSSSAPFNSTFNPELPLPPLPSYQQQHSPGSNAGSSRGHVPLGDIMSNGDTSPSFSNSAAARGGSSSSSSSSSSVGSGIRPGSVPGSVPAGSVPPANATRYYFDTFEADGRAIYWTLAR